MYSNWTQDSGSVIYLCKTFLLNVYCSKNYSMSCCHLSHHPATVAFSDETIWLSQWLATLDNHCLTISKVNTDLTSVFIIWQELIWSAKKYANIQVFAKTFTLISSLYLGLQVSTLNWSWTYSWTICSDPFQLLILPLIIKSKHFTISTVHGLIYLSVTSFF